VAGSKMVIAGSCECDIVGMLSHQLLQHVIDGKKAIIQNPSEAQRSVCFTGSKYVEKFLFVNWG